MMLHYVEAAIMADMPDRAARRLKRVADADAGCPDAGCPDAAFLQGLAAARAQNYTKPLALFEQGRSMAEADGHFAFAAADVHLALRQFDAAYTALAALPPTGDKFIKEAEVHAAAGDFAAAARAMRRANALGACHAGVFTRLATFSRAAKDLPAAEAAIARALAISPNAQDARLEAARIKKARGQTAEYRAILAEILAGMKEQYRLDGKG
jgi:tetratricopeptide (TPR) repeat protein